MSANTRNATRGGVASRSLIDLPCGGKAESAFNLDEKRKSARDVG